MTASEHHPILIVGAGPSGFTAALELARRKIPFQLIERREGPSPLSRAVGILPGSMAIFADCGVADAIRENAIEAEAFEIYDRSDPVASIRMDGHPDSSMRILCLPQDRTEAILREGVERHGGTVEYGQAFEALSQDNDCVTATVNGRSDTYAAVLGCDGARSSVRSAIGLEAEGFDLAEDWSIADLDIPEWQDRRFRISLLPQGELVLIAPIAAGRFRMVTTEPDPLALNPIRLPDHTVRRTDVFRIGIRQVPNYRVGNVWLAGDAAHTHSPVGGRGMNLGIADASEWVRRYVDGTLDGYGASRHAQGKETIETTERIRKMLVNASPLQRKAILLAARLTGMASFLHPSITRAIVMAGS